MHRWQLKYIDPANVRNIKIKLISTFENPFNAVRWAFHKATKEHECSWKDLDFEVFDDGDPYNCWIEIRYSKTGPYYKVERE